MPRTVSPGLQQREKNRLVRLGAGVRLHVGEIAAEQPLRPIDGKLLRHIDMHATAVVAPARIPLGVFVGQHRTLCLQHGGRDKILAGDQFDAVLLAQQFGVEHGGNLRVGLGEGGAEEPLQAGGGTLFVHGADHWQLILIL